METTKLIILVLLFSFCYSAESSSELDSLKDIRTKYLIGDLNEDCFKDTVYGEIINQLKVLPDFIIWGKFDSTVVCDTNRVFLFDSLNVEYTDIQYDSNIVNLISVSTSDFTNDYIKDLKFSMKKIDTVGGDTITHMLIIGDNNLSKNYNVFISNDSLAMDTINCVSLDLSTNSEHLRDYGLHRIYLLNDYFSNSSPLVQTNISNSQLELNDFNVFPNPSNGELNIKVKTPPYNIEIISVTGKELFKKEDVLVQDFQVDISTYPNGMYYVKISDGKNPELFKIMKLN